MCINFLGRVVAYLFTIFTARLSACLVAAAFVATPSNAATSVHCQNTNITIAGILPSAISCVGFVTGNASNNANNTDRSASSLVAKSVYVKSLTGIEAPLTGLDGLTPITFGFMLSGETIIGIHYGGGSYFFSANQLGGPLAFYKFDTVPEPATWMFTLFGMSAVGFAMRRKEKQTLRVRYTLYAAGGGA